MKDSKFYRFMRPIVKVYTNTFLRPEYEGIENIPKDGAIVLAGNHTNILDPLLIMSSTKRSVHFLAKDELWKFPKNIIFDNLGLISVNRRDGDKEALLSAKKCLKEGGIIGIFPEGTTLKEVDLLPFKFGAVKMASDTNTKIVPFAISGDYKIFSKNLKIKYGKPITISKNKNLENDNEKLRNTVMKMYKENITKKE